MKEFTGDAKSGVCASRCWRRGTSQVPCPLEERAELRNDGERPPTCLRHHEPKPCAKNVNTGNGVHRAVLSFLTVLVLIIGRSERAFATTQPPRDMSTSPRNAAPPMCTIDFATDYCDAFPSSSLSLPVACMWHVLEPKGRPNLTQQDCPDLVLDRLPISSFDHPGFHFRANTTTCKTEIHLNDPTSEQRRLRIGCVCRDGIRQHLLCAFDTPAQGCGRYTKTLLLETVDACGNHSTGKLPNAMANGTVATSGKLLPLSPSITPTGGEANRNRTDESGHNNTGKTVGIITGVCIAALLTGCLVFGLYHIHNKAPLQNRGSTNDVIYGSSDEENGQSAAMQTINCGGGGTLTNTQTFSALNTAVMQADLDHPDFVIIDAADSSTMVATSILTSSSTSQEQDLNESSGLSGGSNESLLPMPTATEDDIHTMRRMDTEAVCSSAEQQQNSHQEQSQDSEMLRCNLTYIYKHLNVQEVDYLLYEKDVLSLQQLQLVRAKERGSGNTLANKALLDEMLKSSPAKIKKFIELIIEKIGPLPNSCSTEETSAASQHSSCRD